MSSPFLALRHSKEGILKVELREKYEVYGIIFSSGKPSLESRELSAGFLLIIDQKWLSYLIEVTFQFNAKI